MTIALAEIGAPPSLTANILLPQLNKDTDSPGTLNAGEITFFKRPTIFYQEQMRSTEQQLSESDSDDDDTDTTSGPDIPPSAEPATQSSQPPPPQQPVDFHINTITDGGRKQKKPKAVDADGDAIRKTHHKQRKLNRPQFSREDEDLII